MFYLHRDWRWTSRGASDNILKHSTCKLLFPVQKKASYHYQLSCSFLKEFLGFLFVPPADFRHKIQNGQNVSLVFSTGRLTKKGVLFYPKKLWGHALFYLIWIWTISITVEFEGNKNSSNDLRYYLTWVFSRVFWKVNKLFFLQVFEVWMFLRW